MLLRIFCGLAFLIGIEARAAYLVWFLPTGGSTCGTVALSQIRFKTAATGATWQVCAVTGSYSATGTITAAELGYTISGGAVQFYSVLFLGACDGLQDMTYGGTWSSCSFTPTLSCAAGPAQYKYDRTINNPTLSTLKVTVTEKDAAGAVIGTTTEFLAPGDSLRVQFAEAAAGQVVYDVQSLNSDGTVETVYTTTDGTGTWTQTYGSPTPGATVKASIPVPQDTTSKTSGNIDFATGAVTAKDETLQTGFSAIRKGLGEVATDSRDQSRRIVEAVNSDTVANVAGNSLLTDIKSLLTTANTERTDAETGANTSAVNAWNASGASQASTANTTPGGTMTTIRGNLSTAWMPSVTATPSLWDFPIVGNINPRIWQTNSAVDTVRIYCRGLLQVILLIGFSYLFSKVISQAYADVSQANQTTAVNAALGASLPISIPLALAATAAVFVGVASAVAVGWSALLAELAVPGSVTSTPTFFAEITAIVNEWFPIVGALTALVVYGASSVLVRAAAILASLVRNLIPA